MTRRITAVALSALFLLAALVPAATIAASSAPLPNRIAAVGDSITRAASTGGTLGADAPQNSWSTGTSTTVNSHFLRLRALNPAITAHNLAVSGAKVADLNGQMLNVVTLDPDPGYLTVLIGGNDLCTDTVAQMTSVADFRARFATAMHTITTQSPGTYVYVVSIPDVYQLWELYRSNLVARLVWASAGICQSLLANPGSTQAADVQRRAAVRQRNIDYNTQLAEVCAQHTTRCRFDGNAVFNTRLQRSDVSGDYFHPSASGQARLAETSWAAGYAWTTAPPSNQAPTASFTHECTGLTCTFTDTSTDDVGIATRTWSFGDGAGSSQPNATHTYSADGTYVVTLSVTDGAGLSDFTSGTVTVSAPVTQAKIRVASLAGSGQEVNRNFWRANVTATVTDTTGAAVAGATVTGSFSTGSGKSCTTGGNGSCILASDNLRANVGSTVFTVSGVSHATLVYDPTANVQGIVTITRP